MINLPFEYVSVADAKQIILQQDSLMSLPDTCGFFLCQQGYVDVTLNDRTYHIQAGDIYFYAPSTYVTILAISDDVAGITVKCQMEFVLPLLEHVIDGQRLLTVRDHPCISLTPKQQQRIEFLSDIMAEHRKALQSNADKGSDSLLQNLTLSLAHTIFYELLYVYSCNQSIEPQILDGKDRIFQSFLISLFKNYKRERDVTFYAEEQHLTPRYFSSIVKEKSGHSALQWIIQMVVSSACQMLRDTDKSIKEIAAEFNFPSQSFFGKYFKQYVGISPKTYRQNL